MIKDLGPNVLNLMPGPESNDHWEDENGLCFPPLDDQRTAAKAAGDYLINSEVLLAVGDSYAYEFTGVLHWKHDNERALWALYTARLP
jgi:hypothetical protein